MSNFTANIGLAPPPEPRISTQNIDEGSCKGESIVKKMAQTSIQDSVDIKYQENETEEEDEEDRASENQSIDHSSSDNALQTESAPKVASKAVRLFNVKVLVPPLNFALVAEDVYRSGHPLEINYPFIENLNLRTIVYIGDPPSSKDKNKDVNSVKIFQRFQEWAKDKNIRLVHFHQPAAKEPFRENDKDIIRQTLEIILDTRNLPVLLNSNKGKHRIGVLIGVMRVLLQGWSLATTFDEYIKFANGKSDADLEFIERFREVIEYDPEFAPQWLRRVQ